MTTSAPRCLLRAVGAARRRACPGLRRPDLVWPELREYRDGVIGDLDDSEQVAGYERQVATVVKADGRLVGPGQVEADRRVLHAEHVILATRSRPLRPPIDGLAKAPVWTSREATAPTDTPGSADRRQHRGRGTRPAPRPHGQRRHHRAASTAPAGPRRIRPSHFVGKHLQAGGIDLRLGYQAEAAQHDGTGTIVVLDGGSQLRTEVIVLAASPRPNISASACTPSASSSTSTGRYRSTSTVRSLTGCEPWATPPVSPCPPMSRCTRAG